MNSLERKQAQTIDFLRCENMRLRNENHELKKLLEGNDGMSVQEIRAQFIALHRDYLAAIKSK